MRPHEEEWRTKANGDVVDADDVVVARVYGAGERAEREALICSAPAMARALMAFLPEGGHSMECGNISDEPERCSEECRNARAALKSAGVLHD